MSSAPAPWWAKAAKAASISRSLLAFKVRICSPRARAATRASLSCDSAAAAVGLTSTPITPAFGTTSRRSSSCLDSKSGPVKKEMPVILPPGRLSLATRPTFTGSSPVANTMGIVAVAALAACAAGSP